MIQILHAMRIAATVITKQTFKHTLHHETNHITCREKLKADMTRYLLKN
jgi:hypothetical protein